MYKNLISQKEGREERQPVKSFIALGVIFLALFLIFSFSFVSSIPCEAGNCLDFSYPTQINYTIIVANSTVNNSQCWLGHCTNDGSWLTFNSANFSQSVLTDTPLRFNFYDEFAGSSSSSIGFGDWIIDETTGVLSRFDVWTDSDFCFSGAGLGTGASKMCIGSVLDVDIPITASSIDATGKITGNNVTDGTCSISGGAIKGCSGVGNANYQFTTNSFNGSGDFNTTGKIKSSYITINQTADSQGIRLWGYDDRAGANMSAYIDSDGAGNFDGTGITMRFLADRFVMRCTKSNDNLYFDLGDPNGASKMLIRNSYFAIVSSIDSLGNFNTTGNITSPVIKATSSTSTLQIQPDATGTGVGIDLFRNAASGDRGVFSLYGYADTPGSGGARKMHSNMSIDAFGRFVFGGDVLSHVINTDLAIGTAKKIYFGGSLTGGIIQNSASGAGRMHMVLFGGNDSSDKPIWVLTSESQLGLNFSVSTTDQKPQLWIHDGSSDKTNLMKLYHNGTNGIINATGGLDIPTNLTANLYKSEGKAGVNVSGTSCTITEITNGIITGGSCT